MQIDDGKTMTARNGGILNALLENRCNSQHNSKLAGTVTIDLRHTVSKVFTVYVIEVAAFF